MHMQGHGRTISVPRAAVHPLIRVNPLPSRVDQERALSKPELLVFAFWHRKLFAIGVDVVLEVA